MKLYIIALLAAISYAQTANQKVAGNADAQVTEVASCWPWWCFPATSNTGDGADGEGCKMWIAHALARGCSPYGGFRPWEQYMRPAMYPVGPVMGPGMPIQGPAPAADTNQNAVQDGDATGTNTEEQNTQEQNAQGRSGFTEGLKLEKPAVQEPEKAALVEEKAAPVEEKEIVEKETPAKKLRHTSPHTKKVLKAIHVNEQWNNTGMWFGLSFLFLVLGALAGYGIMHYLQKRQAMSCLAGYGWDIPLTSRTDDL